MTHNTTVEVWLNDVQVGQVVVVHAAGADIIQIAASARSALANDATFVADGVTLTTEQIKEWQA